MLALYPWDIPGQPMQLHPRGGWGRQWLSSQQHSSSLLFPTHEIKPSLKPPEPVHKLSPKTSLRPMPADVCLCRSCQVKDIVPLFGRGTPLVNWEVCAYVSSDFVCFIHCTAQPFCLQPCYLHSRGRSSQVACPCQIPVALWNVRNAHYNAVP